MRDFLDITDFSIEELNDLILKAIDIKNNPDKYSDVMKGKKLATLFWEPSTRTRLSFTAAMMELGGNVLGFSGADESSVTKGESVADTVRVLSCYSDIIAMRTPMEGAAYVASKFATIPIINAGDGSHCHPTQTLADMMTIYEKNATFDNLTVGFCGDLKYGRTVHSLMNALMRYKNIKAVFISPKELRIPDYLKNELDKNNIEYVETTSLEDSMSNLDVLYMTRIQRERFDDKDEYERLKDSYCLTKEKLNYANEKMLVLHPLPRVNEISVDVDDDPRACYFKQVLNGKFMREALIIKLLEDAKTNPVRTKENEDDIITGLVCDNPKCISKTEQELPQKFKLIGDNRCKCIYCEKEYKK